MTDPFTPDAGETIETIAPRILARIISLDDQLDDDVNILVGAIDEDGEAEAITELIMSMREVGDDIGIIVATAALRRLALDRIAKNEGDR